MGGAVWLVLLVFAASLIGGALVRAVGLGESPEALLAAQTVLPTALVAWYGLRRQRGGVRALLALPWPGAAAVAGLTVGMLGFWIMLYQGFAAITQVLPIPEVLLEMLEERTGGHWFTMGIAISLGATAEEVLFRGVILVGLLHRYAPARAIILSALVFAVAHVVPWSIYASFAGGLLLGWVYYRTRSVIWCALVHAAHNLASDSYLSAVARLAGMEPLDTAAPVVPLLPAGVFAIGVALAAAGFWLADRHLTGRPPAAAD